MLKMLLRRLAFFWLALFYLACLKKKADLLTFRYIEHKNEQIKKGADLFSGC